jgi:hypothetical protein
MRCSTNVHEGYCGIDLHARTMDCLSLQPTVCLGVTSLAANICGCDDGRIEPTRY